MGSQCCGARPFAARIVLEAAWQARAASLRRDGRPSKQRMAFRGQPPARRRGLRTLLLGLALVMALGCISLLVDTNGAARSAAALQQEVFSAIGVAAGDLGNSGKGAPAENDASWGRRWGAARIGRPSAAQLKEIKQRCALTRGTWCADYYSQLEVPAVPAPRGRKTCSMDCNKVGTCDALTGACSCPAGWSGFNCIHPEKRFCTHQYRAHGFEVERQPKYLPNTGADPNSMAFSRCAAGECDEAVAICYCPANTTFGRIPAPQNAPMDAPPQQHGRPMHPECQPNNFLGGTRDPNELFGPDGWCTAKESKTDCPCNVPGFAGRYCDEPIEEYCANSCNGRGDCFSGFCKCHKGWHGIDCAHRSVYVNDTVPSLVQQRPWLAETIHTPAGQQFAQNATRKRPLIYVYEMPAHFNAMLLQHRWVNGGREFCTPRFFGGANETVFSFWTYALEPGFLEMLLQSEHRTLDPEEADFFYVPVFTSCFIWPVRDGADALRDFYYSVGHNRVMGATNMLLEAFHWIRAHQPYWDRRSGRDHIWLVTHDEGSCWVPAVLRPSIILSHWGRTELNHSALSGYSYMDSYSFNYTDPQFEPNGFLSKLGSFPCFDPSKDLVLPSMKKPDHWKASPLLGAPTRERTWLAFHRGRVQHHLPIFSRGSRQRVDNVSREHNWLEKYKMAVAGSDNGVPGSAIEGDYSELLASSVFCLVLQGDGWTARMEDAVLHGCIPVVIIDDVQAPFESIVDVTAFSLRVPMADIDKLPEILTGVSEKRRQEMRRNMALVWQRFSYSSWRPYAKRIRELQTEHAAARGGGKQQQAALSLLETVPDLDPARDDAFHTVMAWLHSRIDATR